MKRVALFLVLGAIAAVAAQTSAMIPEQVKIDMGVVAGATGTGQPAVRVFKGGQAVLELQQVARRS